MLRFWMAITLLFTLITSPKAWAVESGEKDGGWISMGGELFEGTNNPWYLKNVLTVRYCVSLDAASVSADATLIQRSLQKALDYWKQQLGSQTLNRAGIGRQEFLQIICDGTEDLRFQFGEGSLSPEQRAAIGDVGRYIGLAMRTSYDPQAMRARGFVFVGSDQGPHRFRSTSVDKAWSHEGLLLRILIHELGHVFGIPHIGDGLMASTFPDKMMSNWTVYERNDNLPGFFTAPQKFSYCRFSAEAARFFGAPLDSTCLEFNRDSNNKHILVSSLKDSRIQKLGTIQNLFAEDEDFLTIVSLWLPPEQKVFEASAIVPGLALSIERFSGEYLNESTGVRTPIFLRLSGQKQEILGLLNGRISLLLD